MSIVPAVRQRLASRWQTFERWVGTRSSAVALFVLALAVFGLQSVILPVFPGRDMATYVQAFLQLGYHTPVQPSAINARGPVAALGVGIPLEAGGWAAEVWLGLLYASSIVAWGAVARLFGARAAVLTTGLLLVYPGYGILFHELASDSLFAAAFAGWALLLSKAILRPLVKTYLLAGLGMGLLVLVRPANQVLIVFALIPLLHRAPWSRRLAWMAAFFVASEAATQGWLTLKHLRYGDAVATRPTNATLATIFVLALLLLPIGGRHRLAVLALLAVVGAAGVVAATGFGTQNPAHYARSLAQSPGGQVFLFRAFEIDRIVSPDNGPASRKLAQVVQRELLTEEPYRSYGIDVHEFFSSGSDRIFQDLSSLGGSVDLPAVTQEAIRRHWRAFAAGIARTTWELLWTRRVYSPAGGSQPSPQAGQGSPGAEATGFIVVNGRRLPRPSKGQPIPASHFGQQLMTLGGQAREVWRSPTQHPLVFADPRDERRFAKFERDTNRLSARIPTRQANRGLAHRLNQASHAFPPPLAWLALGLLALGVRRPRRSRVALALAAAGLAVIVGTAFVAFAVGEYAAPVSPAFVLLAAVGLVGAQPRGRPQWHRAS